MFSLLYQIPICLQRLYRGVAWRIDNGRTIYLTFDDGPIPEMTPRILDILREKGVKATFFVVGDNVRKYPHLLESIKADGHGVGNHTFHHLPGLKTSLAEYLHDVSKCDELVHSTLFRPPYGRMRRSQKRELRNLGYKIILWDVLTHDYNPNYSTDNLVEIVRKYSRPGSIVVFHDSLKSGERMLAALPIAIDYWQANGYELKIL